MSRGPSYYPIDDAAPVSCEVFKEAAMPTDPVKRQQRIDVKYAIFELFFGTEEERAAGIRFPFHELPTEAVTVMSPEIRFMYERDAAVARDPRSGSRFIPHSPVD